MAKPKMSPSCCTRGSHGPTSSIAIEYGHRELDAFGEDLVDVSDHMSDANDMRGEREETTCQETDDITRTDDSYALMIESKFCLQSSDSRYARAQLQVCTFFSDGRPKMSY